MYRGFVGRDTPVFDVPKCGGRWAGANRAGSRGEKSTIYWPANSEGLNNRQPAPDVADSR